MTTEIDSKQVFLKLREVRILNKNRNNIMSLFILLLFYFVS